MLQFVNIFSWNKSTKQGWWGGAHKCPSGIFMHKDNRPLTFLRQGWQGWDCCSENRNEQSRRGEWRPVAALSCCASSQPSLCCALSWEASGSRIPWSVSAAAPDQELQWHNPSSFLLHELTSSSQLWMDRNLLLSSCELWCAIATSALSALTNFTCVWETELSSAVPPQDLGTRVIPGSYSCWYSMRLCPGNNQWAGGQS